MNRRASAPEAGPPGGPRPSRRTAAAWNIGFVYGSFGLQVVRHLVLVPIYLRYIGLHEYGAWLATGAVLGSLLATDFGLMGVVIQRTAAAYGVGDMDRLGRTIGTSLVVATGLALAVSVLAAGLTPFVAGLMGVTGPVAGRLEDCFLITVVSSGLTLVAIATGGILRSLQRPLAPGILLLASDAVGIVLTLGLLVLGWGLYALALGAALGNLVAVLGNAASCLRVCHRRLGLRLVWTRDDARGLFRDSSHQLLTFLAMRLQERVDPFFVGLLLGPAPAAVYALTIRAHDMVRSINHQFGNALSPSLAHLHGDGSAARFRDVFRMMVTVCAIFGAVGMAGVAALNRPFVSLWVGPELFGGTALTMLYALFGVVAILGSAAYQVLLAAGRFAALSKTVVLSTGMRLGLIVVLLPLGLWAAGAAALAAGVFQTTILGVAAARDLRLAPGGLGDLARLLARIYLPVLGLAVLVTELAPAPAGWPALVVMALAFAVLGLGTVALVNRETFRVLGLEIRGTLFPHRR
jgi:O-antigen/teichoic acid export membrane protein